MNPRILEALAAVKAAEEANPSPATQVAQMALRAALAQIAQLAMPFEAARARMAAALAAAAELTKPSEADRARMAAITKGIQGAAMFVRDNDAATKAAMEAYLSVMDGAVRIAEEAAARAAESVARMGPRYAAVLDHSAAFPHFLITSIGEELVGELAAAAAREEIKAAGLPEAANVLLTRWTCESLDRVRLAMLSANTSLADGADLWGLWARATKAPGKLLLWDDLLLTELGRLGSSKGQERRAAAQKRWATSLAADGFADGPDHPDVDLFRLWIIEGGTCKAALWLASAILETRHAELIPRHPALVAPVHRAFGDFLANPRTIPADDRQLTIPGFIPARDVTASAIRKALEAASRVSLTTANRLIRFLVRAGALADRYGREGAVILADGVEIRLLVIGAELVVMEGGYRRLAEVIGEHSKDSRVRDVVAVLEAHAIRVDAEEGPDTRRILWRPDSGRRGGPLALHLSALLLPGFVASLTRWGDKVLIPVLSCPDLTGIPAKWAGPALTLDWRASYKLATNRRELVARGSIPWNFEQEARKLPGVERAREFATRVVDVFCGPDGRYSYDVANGGRLAFREGGEEALALELLTEGVEQGNRRRQAGLVTSRKRKG